MRTETEIEQRMSREFLLFYVPVVFLWGVVAAFFIDSFWWRGLAVAFVASVFASIGGFRRVLLMRKLRLAKLDLFD